MLALYILDPEIPVGQERAAPEALQTLLRSGKSVWLNLCKPSNEECQWVHSMLSIPMDALRAAFDYHERPRAERLENGALLIARAATPADDDRQHIPQRGTCPIAVILHDKVIITVCLVEHAIENLILHKILGQGDHLPERLALTLLLRISTTFIKNLQIMNEQLDGMEKVLYQSMHNKELIGMLHLEKGLIFYLTALKGNHAVLEKIRATHPITQCKECSALLDDVIIENKQATDMAEIFSQVLGSISETFASIVSNNLNKVMKLLTGLTIVFMIPTIIGGIYGMNVALPGAESPYAFLGLCGVCVSFSVAVFWFLRKRDWI